MQRAAGLQQAQALAPDTFSCLRPPLRLLRLQTEARSSLAAKAREAAAAPTMAW